jgi:hypothetical protein
LDGVGIQTALHATQERIGAGGSADAANTLGRCPRRPEHALRIRCVGTDFGGNSELAEHFPELHPAGEIPAG